MRQLFFLPNNPTMVFGLIVACFKPNGNTSMAEAEDSDDDIPLFPRLPDPDDEPLFPGPLFPGPIVPLDPAPPLPPDLVADSDDDVFPLDSDDEPLFPGPPLNPAPPVPPPAVMMVPFTMINHHYPLTIVSDACETLPPIHVPFYFPALGSSDEDEAMPTLIPDDDDENEYDHIDNRAIDVTLDIPSANPNIMNVTSRHQEKYANLSC